MHSTMLAMLEPDYSYYNGSELNFTASFNATSMGNIDNTNASRHFADQPNLTSMITFTDVFLGAFLLFVSITVVSYIFMFIRVHGFERRILTVSSREDTSREAVPTVPHRTHRLSVIQNGITDQMFANDDENMTIDTPSSIYPGDMLPNYSDSKERIFSDVITTPISNNSVITMTMKNDHLIVETEERVPVNISNCSYIGLDEMYSNIMVNAGDYLSPATKEYDTHELDDANGYAESQRLQSECAVSIEDRRPFYAPTTSRQADEEDQHIELFHKNILVFPKTTAYESDNVPSCSYEYSEAPTTSSPRRRGRDSANAGPTPSDATGSSSSNTSRHARNNYDYGNQSEYVPQEFPLRKYTSTNRLSNLEKTEVVNVSYSPPRLLRQSQEDSVLQLTDCSSPEFSEPSK